MLKARVIPTLLWKGFGLVKGVGFDSWRGVGAVMPAVKVYNRRDVDELVLLDIVATSEGRVPDYETVEELAAECFVPFTVGGGVSDVETVRGLLRAGADKVAINSAAYADPTLIQAASDLFGAQCIVVGIDATRRPDGTYECLAHSGTKATGETPVAWAKRVEELGAGEILLTSVERDGTLQGYDLTLVEEVARAVRIPVIASGGAGTFEHLHAAIERGATAVAAASMFHFTEQTPREAKAYLKSRGVAVRT